jgi:hypothetical protein
MSWDAYIGDESWNYTHNTNEMISTAIEKHGYTPEKHWLIGHMGKSWFKILDKMDGKTGAEFLGLIIQELIENPKEYKKMNPDNGWGSYSTLLPILIEMKQASEEHPDEKWIVHG